MGTRNVTIVKLGGKTKIAQYGQWDGYPTGQGEVIAEFLRTVDLEKFKEQVKKLGVWTNKEIDQAYVKAGAEPGSDWVLMEVGDRVKALHPELSRDFGAKILDLVHEGIVTKVVLNEKFKSDKVWCEYWYDIDLDAETVTMNGTMFSFEDWKRKGFMEELEDND